MLSSEVVWVVTCEDPHGARRWFGLEVGYQRQERFGPEVRWDSVQCQRTVQFTTRGLAERRISEIVYAQVFVGFNLRIEEVDREFMAATIGLVHSKSWLDDD